MALGLLLLPESKDNVVSQADLVGENIENIDTGLIEPTDKLTFLSNVIYHSCQVCSQHSSCFGTVHLLSLGLSSPCELYAWLSLRLNQASAHMSPPQRGLPQSLSPKGLSSSPDTLYHITLFHFFKLHL